MGAKLVKGPPERIKFDQLLEYLKIDSQELDAAIERNRSSLPIWKRGITFHLFKLYLMRCTRTKKPFHPVQRGFDRSMTSYAMLDMVKQDTAKWECSIAELVAAMEECAQTRKLQRYPHLAFRPTHFLSYSWAFPLEDIYGEATSITKTCGDDWGLWIDILTINQHQGEKTATDLQNLDRVIETIGNVVFVVDSRGIAMSRVWCLYEVMTAVRCGAKITALFMGESLNAYDAAIVAFAVLAGRFDDVDIQKAQATVESDKAMILGQIQENPGVDQLNETIRTTLRKCAQDEFNKERMNFGSVWWSGKINFPSWLQANVVKLIRDASSATADASSRKSGGGAAGGETEPPRNPCSALLVSAEEEERALQAAVASGEAEGKNLDWWRPKPKGSLDRDSPLYAKLKLILEIATWSVRKEPLVDWEDFCKRVRRAEEFQAQKKKEDEEKAQRKAARKAQKTLERQSASSGGGDNNSGSTASIGGGSGDTGSSVGALLLSSDSSDSDLESQTAEDSYCSSNFSDSPSPGESSESDAIEADDAESLGES